MEYELTTFRLLLQTLLLKAIVQGKRIPDWGGVTPTILPDVQCFLTLQTIHTNFVGLLLTGVRFSLETIGEST